jgi:hypothetical protein
VLDDRGHEAIRCRHRGLTAHGHHNAQMCKKEFSPHAIYRLLRDASGLQQNKCRRAVVSACRFLRLDIVAFHCDPLYWNTRTGGLAIRRRRAYCLSNILALAFWHVKVLSRLFATNAFLLLVEADRARMFILPTKPAQQLSLGDRVSCDQYNAVVVLCIYVYLQHQCLGWEREIIESRLESKC